jgi:hypothetical protein
MFEVWILNPKKLSAEKIERGGEKSSKPTSEITSDPNKGRFDELQGMSERLPQSFTPLWDPFADV